MQNDQLQLTRRFLKALLAHRAALLGMVFCMVMVGLLEPLLPALIQPLLDSAAGDKSFIVSVTWLPIVLLLIMFLRSVFSYGRAYLGAWLDSTMQRDFRAVMAAHLLRLPAKRLQTDETGLLTSRFMAYLPSLTAPLMPFLMAIIQEPIKVVVYIALMLYWQWQLALIVLSIAPLTVLMIRYMGRRMKKSATESQRAIALTQNRLNETIEAWPIIKVQSGDKAQHHLRAAFSRLRQTQLRIGVILSAGQPLTHLLLAVPFAFVIAYIVNALQAGAMSAGTAASFLTVMLLLPVPLRNFTRAMSTWQQILAAAREVYTFLDQQAEEDNGKQTLDRADGALTFDAVTFRYDADAPPALVNFSLAIAAGETIALVGRSGAGKTTLSSLLPRFYAAESGNIHLDGVDITDITLESLRRQISLVTQKPLLFDDTVAANIAYPDSGDEEPQRMEQALRNAAADDFVAALPDGVQTRIGEGGNRLSGGQRQRLALARAFYRDAPIVILDEATSSLDAETEAKIKKAMRHLLVGRTAIIVAHHFATIDFADRIAVMDKGELVAVGKMDELLTDCPLFAELYNAQKLA